MIKKSITFVLLLLVYGCSILKLEQESSSKNSKEQAADSVKLRVYNDTSIDFIQVTIDGVSFGTITAGSTTDYKNVSFESDYSIKTEFEDFTDNYSVNTSYNSCTFTVNPLLVKILKVSNTDSSGYNLEDDCIDTTAPTPGNSGKIFSSFVSTTSLKLSWSSATDNIDYQSELQYLVYYSSSNNIDTLANCESNGTKIGSYQTNKTSTNVTELSSNTSYYFNVVVKDTSGNKMVYTTKEEKTAILFPSGYISRWKLNNNGYAQNSECHLINSSGSPAYSTLSPKEGYYYLTVDGSDDIYSSTVYDIPSSNISVTGWFYLNSNYTGTNPTALDIGGIGIWYNSNGKISGGPTRDIYAEGIISTNYWYHVTFTWDNATVKLYINSILQESNTGITDTQTVSAPVYLGSQSGSNFWNGSIDDVIIYDRVLTQQEITDIFNSYSDN